jgi:hypothetical protein
LNGANIDADRKIFSSRIENLRGLNRGDLGVRR